MNYYISATGNDSSDGLSTSTPWKTIAKVNSKTYNPGDSILFKRGDTFYGALAVSSTLTLLTVGDITVGAYGNGALPKISLYKHLDPTGWSLHSGNIWKFDLTVTSKVTGYATVNTFALNVGFLLLDRVVRPNKKSAVGSLSADFDFYSDRTQYLYMYSAVNPNTLAAISASSGLSVISTSNIVTGLAYTTLDIVGCGGHGAGGVFTNTVITGCHIHEIGGSILSDVFPVRYGNGVEVWKGSSNVKVFGNTIWDIYDTATTMQGTSVSDSAQWSDVAFYDNVLFRANQAFEVFAELNGNTVASTTGFTNTSFTNNICFDIGYSPFSTADYGTSLRAPILLGGIEVQKFDLKITGNSFYNFYSSLIRQSDNPLYPPAGFVLDGNYVFGEETQLIHSNLPYTLGQFDQFSSVRGTGFGCIFTKMASQAPASIPAAIDALLVQHSFEASSINVITNTIQNVYSDLALFRGEVRQSINDLYSITKSTRCETFRVGTAVPFGYGKLFTLTTTSKNIGNRFDGVLMYTIGNAEYNNRNSAGMLSIQFKPSSTLLAGTNYVDLDVSPLVKFNTAGNYVYTPGDFVGVMTTEDGTTATLDVYFNVGKVSYARMQGHMLLNIFDKTQLTVTYHTGLLLVTTLPAGTQTIGTSLDTGYQQIPLLGAGAPTSTPIVMGQKYLDTSAKKEYTAFGVASSADWAILN